MMKIRYQVIISGRRKDAETNTVKKIRTQTAKLKSVNCKFSKFYKYNHMIISYKCIYSIYK